MSERDTPQFEERVSPYLLRPARTYEEYLRDCNAAERSSDRDEATSSSARDEETKQVVSQTD